MNAFVASRCDYRQAGSEEFDAIAKVLISRIVRAGVLPFAVNAGMGVGGIAAGLLVFGWPIMLPPWARIVILLVAPTLFLLRGHLLSSLLSSRLISDGEGSVRLEAVESGVEHVFCATDLASNRPFFFTTWSGGHAYTPTRLWSSAGHVTLSSVVRASSAFPGAFPPKRSRVGSSRFLKRRNSLEFVRETRRRQEAEQARPSWMEVHHRTWRDRLRQLRWRAEERRDRRRRRPPQLKVAYLADGGVWNNLGTDWMQSWARRRSAAVAYRNELGTDPMPMGASPSSVIVVNASLPVASARLHRLSIPVVAEAASLTRAMKVLYENTVRPRIDMFRWQTRTRLFLGERNESMLRMPFDAAVASIDESPCVSRTQLYRITSVRRADRAAVTEAQDRSRALQEMARDIPAIEFPDGRWLDLRDVHRVNATVPTKLGRLGGRSALTLLAHGYLATMVECKFVFNLPIEPVEYPGWSRFANLVDLSSRDQPKELKRRPGRLRRGRMGGPLDPKYGTRDPGF